MQFSSNAPTLSFRLSSFEKTILKNVSVSEAAVERLFSRHKRIHLPLRACLYPDVARKCLFIRINQGKLEEGTNTFDADVFEPFSNELLICFFNCIE